METMTTSKVFSCTRKRNMALPELPSLPTWKTLMIPDLKSVLLLQETGHPSSAIDSEGTKTVCKALGIQFNEMFCSSKEDAVQAVGRL